MSYVIFNEGLSNNLNRSAQSELTTNIKTVSITVTDLQTQIDVLRGQVQELISLINSLMTPPPVNPLTS
jgi:uncharacterized protein YoxC